MLPRELIRPEWPAPPTVAALSTTRHGGVSQGSYASLNLGGHVGDNPARVARNREILGEFLPAEVDWLEQVHGCDVSTDQAPLAQADAGFSRMPGVVRAVMTADCLPVLMCNRSGTAVAAVHAGWRGLATGVLERALACFDDDPAQILAWLGPAIGPTAFEVGEEVRDAFVSGLPDAAQAFTAHGSGHWLADLYRLARQRLHRAGIKAVYGGGCCTYTQADRFFSYRRDRATGRMASLIWLTQQQPRGTP